ncbi:BtpA/SgcQ family protein [Clostridium sp. AM58-1XD]|uniref:BtpA/SgcQ family protein n=1 Tax=Clostridium sp. AM58-1XD TaxID=2292307 RepID=UPI000E4B8063|nr:BtpA/SgcQ family protein [Clostridium sp. AM58-1XD]RGZ00896.1 BtpA family membrane complex biogenesis protein [Clostridium sp. AM58-1XD]
MSEKIKLPMVLSMIQPEPLPGSYRHESMKIGEIADLVLREADMVVKNGFDGFILQNMNDMPVKQTAPVEAVAYMTVIGERLKREFPEAILGILVNWDGVAALSVADAVGADFVRVEHLFTGAEVTSAGLLQAQCCEIAALRKKIKSRIPVYADVYEVHGVPLGAKKIEDAAWESVHEAFADGLFMAGKTSEESIAMVKRARTRTGSVPIFLGGGATGDNICELLQYYDGVSVATWVKDGDMKNPINPDKARIFMEQVQKAKEMKLVNQHT